MVPGPILRGGWHVQALPCVVSTACLQDSRPDALYPSSQIFPSVGVIIVPMFAEEEISSEQLIESELNSLCRRPEAEQGVKPGSVCPQRPLWVSWHRLP